ncbi:MAG TPA: OmpH family outer membrane protein [Terriglobia bacterium]|nr:OmpH family outer membrane protein [Terriglobia bacterium]
MKNRYLTLAALSALLLGAPVGRCQGAAAASTGGKIGVINIQQAIAGTAEGKKALAALDVKYAPKRDKLQKDQADISAIQDQLQKQAATLSDDERERLTRELSDKQRLFKREQEDDQADFQADSQDAVQRIGQRMVKVIDDYAAQNGFAVVLDPVAVQMPVYYVGKGVDITDPIVKLYDQANPATGAPAAKPAATKPKP